MNRAEMEKDLEERFLGRRIKFVYPGKEPVYGRVESIGVETHPEPIVNLRIDTLMHQVSPEDVEDCLTLLTAR